MFKLSIVELPGCNQFCIILSHAFHDKPWYPFIPSYRLILTSSITALLPLWVISPLYNFFPITSYQYIKPIYLLVDQFSHLSMNYNDAPRYSHYIVTVFPIYLRFITNPITSPLHCQYLTPFYGDGLQLHPLAYQWPSQELIGGAYHKRPMFQAHISGNIPRIYALLQYLHSRIRKKNTKNNRII